MDEPFALAEMMAPLPGGPGADPRASGPASDLYLTVKDRRAAARIAEREALRSGDPDADPLEAGLKAWREVAAGGAQLLSDHAKDLQVAAWVCEAWVRTDGLPGLADGLSLLSELVERFWDQGLYPEADEEGVETRVAPLFGLFGREDTGTLIQPIKLLALTDAPGERVALWTVEAARAQAVRHDDPEVREQLVERRAQRLGGLEGAIAAASPAFCATSIDAIDHALGELDRLMTVVDRLTGLGRFGSQVAQPLEAIRAILQELGSPVEQSVAPAALPVEGEPDGRAPTPYAAAQPVAPTSVPTLDREEALDRVLEMADFFDTIEPQSLTARGLRDVVRRARLPIEELLAELIPEAEQRRAFLLRAGIRDAEPPQSSSSSSTW